MQDVLIQHTLSSRFGLFVGDATADYVRDGLTRYEQGHGDAAVVSVIGCDVNDGSPVRREIDLAALAEAYHRAAPASNVGFADRGARQRHERSEAFRRRVAEQWSRPQRSAQDGATGGAG